ncbi:MAG: NADH-quinone oxidoreductase subunit I [Chloroflexi bacterium]|nr:NADH-quinone oxidoreductase subunit I [Chloroflexota bacterium]
MLGIGVVKGLLTTFTHLFKKPLTIQYPDERMEMPPWTRGRPRLIYELDSGDLRCVACGACAIACPVDVIKIEQHPGPDRKKVLDRFDIDMGGCIECALCVEACPFRALVMAPDFEMAYYDRASSLVFNMRQLRIAGTPEVDAAMEHLLGVKRGFARTGGDQAKEAAPAAPAPRAAAPAARPAARPVAAAAAAAAPALPAAQGQAAPAARPAIDPKELEGLTPAEKAALYKARQREAGIVPPKRGEQPPAKAPAAEPQATAPAPAQPAPASASGKVEIDPKELEGLSPAERAALYKARQRAAGIAPPGRGESKG